MAKAKTKKITKNISIESSVNTSINTLSNASIDCAKSINICTKNAKSYLTASKRLNKKRTTLIKRKKSTASRLKKMPNVDNRKALKMVEKELAGVKKEIAKLSPVKSTNSAELASLKTTHKRITAYTAVLNRADKVLNKPKKKKRKKSAS